MATPFDENEKRKRPSFNDNVPKGGIDIYVFRMPADRALSFTAWGDEIKGMNVHWLGDRTAMHFDPAEECEHCLTNKPKKWKGYLHVYCSELHQEVFLEFTQRTAESFKMQVANCNHIRGCVFQLKRGKSKNARMDVRILAPVAVTEVLPAGKDPRPFVLKLYGYSDRQIAEWLAVEPAGGSDW